MSDVLQSLSANSQLPIATAAAIAITVLSRRTAFRSSGLWLTLAVLGQAAALQLIEAGPYVRFQHYASPEGLDGTRLVSLGLIVAQCALVSGALLRRRRAIRAFFRGRFRYWRLALVAVAAFLAGAVPSLDLGLYAGELLFSFLIAAIGLGNAALVAAALPSSAVASLEDLARGALGDRGSSDAESRARLDRFALLAALWVLIATATLATVVYERHPHIPDETVYLYQARYLAAGAIEMSPPPVREGFHLDLMSYEENRWYSPLPPGWPAVLSIGVRVGLPWAVNPLLAAAGILLAYLLAWKLAGRRMARMCILLLCLSPWYIYMGMNYMNHTLSLVCALVAALAATNTRLMKGARSYPWALLAGLCIGALSLIRPLEAVIVGLLLGVWIVTRPGSRLRLRLAPAIVFGLASVASTSVNLPYNMHFTGSYARLPLMQYMDETYGPGANALGFGPERGFGWTGLDPFPGHGPIDVVLNADINTVLLNTEMLGWSTGSIFLIILFLVSGRMRYVDWIMVVCILVICGINGLYWFSGGPDFGPRYWYLIIFPCALLTAGAIRYLEDVTPHATRILTFAAALSVSSLFTFFPWRAADKYHGYRGMRPGVTEVAAQAEVGRSLVLIRGPNHPDYASAAIYNPLDLRGEAPVFAWERNADTRTRLLEAYPDRPVFVMEGPSVTGAGYRLVEGPGTQERP